MKRAWSFVPYVVLPAIVLAASLGGAVLLGGPPRPAPSFELPVVAGPGAAEHDRISLDALRGRVVILDFWASWCGPCRESMPLLNQVASRFGNAPVTFVSINVESQLSPEQVAMAHATLGSELSCVQDDGRVKEAYQVRSLPTIVVIDRRGRLVHAEEGAPDPEALGDKIASLLQ